MKTRDILLALLIAAVWGFNFIAAKWAVEDFSPMFANSIRFTAVLFFLLPFLRRVPGKMKPLITTAVTLGVVHFGLIFLGMSFSDGVGSVSIASQLNVPFSTILAVIILKETIGWPRIFGITISFVGVLFLGFDPVIFSYWEGVLIIIVAAFFYAVSAIMMRQLRDVPAATVQAWVALAGMAGSAVVSLLLESGHVEAVETATLRGWLAVLYTAIGSSIVGHAGANYLFRKYEISVVSPYFLTMPVFSVASGVLLMGESVGWEMYVGGGLTIAGVLIVSLRNKQRAARHKEAIEADG